MEKSVALYRQYARDAFNNQDLRACLRGKISPAGARSINPATRMFCWRWRTPPNESAGIYFTASAAPRAWLSI